MTKNKKTVSAGKFNKLIKVVVGKRPVRQIWNSYQLGPYIRAKHGPIGVELDRINQLNEQQNGR